MIQANELRIGNIFWENYGGYKVITAIGCNSVGDMKNTVSARGIGFTLSGQYDCDAISPVLLTPEILEKCGFEKANDRYGGYLSPVFNSGRIRLSWYSETDDDWYWYNGCWNTKIKHLHQLQNLYFSLTGEELTINL